MIEQRVKFENAISELRNLLDEDSNDENKFQSWFEGHPIVMDSLNFKRSIPHPSLKTFNGEIYIPDFIVKQLNDTWEIFELKLPYEKVLKKKERRNTFYAKVYEYCEQCLEYSEFFYDNSNRQNFQRDFGFSIPSPPRSKLIIGRDAGLDRFELNKKINQYTPSIEILTYDDIIRQLEFDKLKVLGRYENIQGLSIHMIAKIKTLNGQNCILSLGSRCNSNNLLIYINDFGQLCYHLKDKYGKEITQSVDQELSKFKFGEWMYFVFEFGFGNDYTVCSAEVNGNYGSVVRTENMVVDLGDFTTNIVIGSNFNGAAKSNFELESFVAWPNTLELFQRLDIRNKLFGDFRNETGAFNDRIVFHNNRFLYLNSNINFEKHPKARMYDYVQIKEDKKPRFVSNENPKDSGLLEILPIANHDDVSKSKT